MFPVALLSIQPSDRVFDMCASPGSKTLQILEALSQSNTPQALLLSPGYCLASDLDEKRASMLAHQTLKLAFPGFLILNEDSTNLPKPKTQGFNKILCDVPCSGDGTSRKNGLILKNWSHKFGVKLHRKQRNLLFKGLSLLEKDGLLVYSTCSLNPIENEAVVNSALEKFKGKIELIDLEEKKVLAINPQWKAGLCHWKVYSKAKKQEYWLESYKDLPKEFRSGVEESMFPGEESGLLYRTRRIYPQDNNTGGFFIAMFKKNEEFEYFHEEKDKNCFEKDEIVKEKEAEEIVKKTEEKKEDKAEKKYEKKKEQKTEEIVKNTEEKEEHKTIAIKKKNKKDNVVLLVLKLKNFVNIMEKSPEIYESIAKFYGICKEFPSENLYGVDPGFDKSSFQPKRLILLNEGLKKFLSSNTDFKELSTISLGVNAFKYIRKENFEIKHRILIESFFFFRPYIKDNENTRIISVDFPAFKSLSSLKSPEKLENFKYFINFDDFKNLSQGPFIIEYKIESQTYHLLLWKGLNQINLLTKLQDLTYLSFRLSLKNKDLF